MPIFALNTKAAWGLRFDDIIADVLELGQLRTEEYILPPEKVEKIQSLKLNNVLFKVFVMLLHITRQMSNLIVNGLYYLLQILIVIIIIPISVKSGRVEFLIAYWLGMLVMVWTELI